MAAYLFDTTDYRSLEELSAALDREIAAASERIGVPIQGYSFEEVGMENVATLWDGTMFITGRLVFTEAEGTPYLAAENALRELRRQAPGGIRIFEFLDEDEIG